MQACQQTCEELDQAGIDHVFGIPGGGDWPSIQCHPRPP